MNLDGLSGAAEDARPDGARAEDAGPAGADAEDEGPADVADGGDAADGGDGAPAPLAKLALFVHRASTAPLTCPASRWEYPLPDGGLLGFLDQDAGTAAIQNKGTVPIAYIARRSWAQGAHYQPGSSTGEPNELVGVIAPGQAVDVSVVVAGLTVALVGSAGAFSDPDASQALDEGTIPWPKGVAGSGGATTMNVAVLELRYGCTAPAQVW